MRVEIKSLENPFANFFGQGSPEVDATISLICDNKEVLFKIKECLEMMEQEDVLALHAQLMQKYFGEDFVEDSDRIKTTLKQKHPRKISKEKNYDAIDWLDISDI